ncbi:spermidine/putrescine transport system ATP-binding protein (plasmid) [Ketogulonicigenium robustum]|uniref:Spermidine/putrescine transport system ATP-binding protein n=1 Tax=Ketogulonicigenium robustum TaxID=92947 RepID=A0A1W6P315_9RHOB|nr:ABC transporter ATP-binding protein [Ketogulonicigenium robustum]ARO15829.1 spermidine/putrescine transport system ATP-binding protein [Ketogulonicigenium robustum]
MASLKIQSLVKRYGETEVVRGLDLDVAEGEMVALLGPSGCGKTTTLRMVAGFITPTSGKIDLGGKDITMLPPHQRDTAMVFQSYALFPHMTVAANVGFGLEMRKIGKSDRDARIKNALEMVQLGHLADRLPKQLSGGQQQRVALARALAVNPSILLLDEPLSNLDAKLRAEVQHEIRALQQRLGLTTLMVTHDQEEALIMADKMVVMEAGIIQQQGTPTDLYESPANVFVAGFIGRCNLVEGAVTAPGTFRANSGASLACAPDTMGTVLALRPEHITLAPMQTGKATGTITRITYLGAQTEYAVNVDGTTLFASTRTPLAGAAIGDQIGLDWDVCQARLLAGTNA